MSLTKSIGFALTTTTNSRPARPSSVNSPQLPSFNATPRRPALGSDARHTSRRHRELDQRYRLERHTQAVAETQARRRTLGNLMVTVFVALAVLMAGYTLNVERHQQQQFQERIN